MITQGSNLPLYFSNIPVSLDSIADISAGLYTREGKELKHWGKDDLTIVENGILAPITQAESMGFPIGRCTIELKMSTNDGLIIPSLRVGGYISRRDDKTALSGEQPQALRYVDIDCSNVMADVGAVVGASAYELAIKNGFTGTVEEWLDSLHGKDGKDGKDGDPGTPGTPGTNGKDGDDGITPHIGANGNWFIGETDTGIKAQGSDGEDGITPHIGANGHWYIGDTDTGVTARGKDGYTPKKGVDYDDGKDGEPGKDGKSAYEYAQEGGYTGTKEEFAHKLATDLQLDDSLKDNTKAAPAGLVGELKEDLKLETEYIDNIAGDWTDNLGTNTVTMSYNGLIWMPTAKKHAINGSGLYLFLIKYSITNISGNNGTITITPVLYNGSTAIYMRKFGGDDTNRQQTSGEDLYETAIGYGVLADDTTLFGISGQNVNGATFTYEFEEIALLPVSGVASYTAGVEKPLASLLEKYGGIKSYPVSKNYDDAVLDSIADSLNIPSSFNYKSFASHKADMPQGGVIKLPVGETAISGSLELSQTNMGVVGEIWGYSEDPNGVFGIENGSRIKLPDNTQSGVNIGGSGSYYSNGLKLKDFGIQGVIMNSNTQGAYNLDDPLKNVGIVLYRGRTDQSLFERIDLNGLGCGLYIAPSMNVDACTFDWLNADGCNVGIYIKTESSYYTVYRNILISDCPAHGIIVDGAIRNCVFDRLIAVRNCGGITDAQKEKYVSANMYFDNLTRCRIQNCFVTQTGTWIEFFSSGDGTPTTHLNDTCRGVILGGTYNEFFNNQIEDSRSHPFECIGEGNIVRGNLLRGRSWSVISGDNNIVDSNIIEANLQFVPSLQYALTISGDNNVIINCGLNRPIHITGNNNRIIHCYATDSSVNNLVVDDGTNNVVV